MFLIYSKAHLFSYQVAVLFHAQFLDNFGLFLETYILLSDLNFHFDKQDSWSKQFNDVL